MVISGKMFIVVIFSDVMKMLFVFSFRRGRKFSKFISLPNDVKLIINRIRFIHIST